MVFNPLTSKLFADSLRFHQEGQFGPAETGYREVLALTPDDERVLHHFAILAHQTGRQPLAIQALRQAIVLVPPAAFFYAILGTAYRAEGRRDDALTQYRWALGLEPTSIEARNNLANIFLDKGDGDAAIRQYKVALAVDPGNALIHYNIGRSLHARNQVTAAIRHLAAAITCQSDYAQAALALAEIYHDHGSDRAALVSRYALSLCPAEPDLMFFLGEISAARHLLGEAARIFARSIALTPMRGDSYNYLGSMAKSEGRLASARSLFTATVILDPGAPQAFNNLGVTGKQQGDLATAHQAYQRAILLAPQFADAIGNFANLLRAESAYDKSIVLYRHALALRPDLIETINNLGMSLQGTDRLVEASVCYRRALQLQLDHRETLTNLGNTLQDKQQFHASIECYRRAMLYKPDFILPHSNMLYCLNYHPDRSADQVFDEYRRWNRQHAKPLMPWEENHQNSRDGSRRVKIGYVSPDFRRHSMRFFLEPLLAYHDRDGFEIFAYAELFQEDDVTRRYRRQVDHWRQTTGLTDAALADLIRSDGIDILVDLTGHTAGHRLLTFARRPAPVQASWIVGYGYTTGLDAIDYLLTDAIMAPAGASRLFSEKLVHLPKYTAYRPDPGMGQPGALPAAKTGRITFGSLTRAVRINHRVIECWRRILNEVPGSRLVVNSRNFRDTGIRQWVAEEFGASGINADRLELGFETPPWNVLRRLDIILDCFPHNSGTTLFEGLYMGLPTISLTDRPSVGRFGATILDAIGRSQWVAATEDEYIAKAVTLAGDLDELARQRAGLRAAMEASPLRDEKGFAKTFGAACRAMWQRWCDGLPPANLTLGGDGQAYAPLELRQ